MAVPSCSLASAHAGGESSLKDLLIRVLALFILRAISFCKSEFLLMKNVVVDDMRQCFTVSKNTMVHRVNFYFTYSLRTG